MDSRYGGIAKGKINGMGIFLDTEDRKSLGKAYRKGDFVCG